MTSIVTVGVARRTIRDLWRIAAREHEKAGRTEEAARARAAAKLWGDGVVRNWKGESLWPD